MSDQRTAIVTGAARGIGAGVAKRLSRDGFAVALFDLDEAAGKPVVEEIEKAGGRALAVGVDVGDEQAVAQAVDRVVERTGCPDGAGEQRRHHPRQPAVQDDGRGLGRRDERAPARCVPDDACDAEVHGRRRVRPDREPLEHVGAGQPGPGQLLGGQGRYAGVRPRRWRSSWASSA